MFKFSKKDQGKVEEKQEELLTPEIARKLSQERAEELAAKTQECIAKFVDMKVKKAVAGGSFCFHIFPEHAISDWCKLFKSESECYFPSLEVFEQWCKDNGWKWEHLTSLYNNSEYIKISW